MEAIDQLPPFKLSANSFYMRIIRHRSQSQDLYMWKYLTALAVAFATAVSAHACRVPKIPFNPLVERSDVVVIGKVFDSHLDGVITGKWFSVRIETVAAGQFSEPVYRTGWPVGLGACGPKGPDVENGDQVTIYFRKRNGKLMEQGWTKAPQ
jgi:hypothetical protein